MEIKEITEKSIWEDFLLKCKEKTFLQSWNWGEFQEKMGNKIWRYGIFENNKLISTALIIKIIAKRGVFLFLPHGPNLIENNKNLKSEILKSLIEEIKKIAREEKASFIRISPILLKNEENIKIFNNLGFREAPIHMHPEVTWELDITPSEELLLMNMRKTTRYLIRQAQKNNDIEILKSQKIEDLEIFNKLYQETAKRHNFVPFSFNYLENEFLVFLKDNQIILFLGKYKNEIVTSAMILFWSEIGFYHHSASSLKYSKIPVSYLLQWEVIKEAKKRGCKIYNFWGIAPNEKKSHPWAGLTLFKIGFGGYKKEYVKTQDLVLNWKYYFNFVIEKIRKQKRGL